MPTFIDLICSCCNKQFQRPLRLTWTQSKSGSDVFCSKKCLGLSRVTAVTKPCTLCAKSVTRVLSQLRSNKTDRIFCNSRCAAKYNNAHKTTGTRVSKLEVYLQKELTELYPNFCFRFNKTDAIEAELDIYIPHLGLAFELNGIFHYEPIFGKEKLESMQNNDLRKVQACLERGIELCVIDSTGLKYFKEERAKKYLDIITGIINTKVAPATGSAPVTSV